ncbi:hypothetical protein GCM10009763_06090 [Dermacoccus profundi]|uniref:Uncharacterized protein n=1 Tax=Dermacoccus profundi TaxID=322602 RepID=A0ABN2CKK7_9MICO
MLSPCQRGRARSPDFPVGSEAGQLVDVRLDNAPLGAYLDDDAAIPRPLEVIEARPVARQLGRLEQDTVDVVGVVERQPRVSERCAPASVDARAANNGGRPSAGDIRHDVLVRLTGRERPVDDEAVFDVEFLWRRGRTRHARSS